MKKNGIIVKALSGFYYVETEGNLYECRARGAFRNQKIIPLVGDRCEIVVLDEVQKKGNVTGLLPRKNTFIRPPIANIDQMGIVFAAAAPIPIPYLIDQLTVVAEHHQIRPFLVMNKMDLQKEENNSLQQAYQLAQYEIFCVSATEKRGIADLRQYLNGKVTVLAGCSGVGKSSILNLLGTNICVQTGGVSKKIQRGRHTTRTVELFPLDQRTFVADSPGFSSLDITQIRAEDLASCFPEIRSYQDGCRFRGCSHVGEPGCVIKEAVQQGRIAQSRYNSYVQMYQTLKEIKEWQR